MDATISRFVRTSGTLQMGVIAGTIALLTIVTEAYLYRQKLAEAEMQKAEAATALSNAERIKGEAEKIKAQAEVTKADAEQIKAQADTAAAEAEMAKAEAQKLMAAAQVRMAEATERSNIGEIHGTTKVADPLLNDPIQNIAALSTEITELKRELQTGLARITHNPLTTTERERKAQQLLLLNERLELQQDATAATLKAIGGVFKKTFNFPPPRPTATQSPSSTSQ